MRFLLDENVDARLVRHLRVAGHDVVSVLDAPGAGSSDTEVLEAASADRRVLVTNDTGFGELILRRGLPHAGVLLLRFETTALAMWQAAIDAVLRDYADRLGEFTVVTEAGVRFRRPRR
jgi:predicted nuclease of predicted toxin-antitoxin system